MRDGLGRVQNVLVVGGTSDIGRATADLLTSAGGTVVLAGRDPARLEAAAATLAAPRRRVMTLAYDAADSGHAVARMVERAVDAAGDLDVVLVCVGTLEDARCLEVDTTATEAALHTNLVAPAVATHAAAMVLAEQGHGVVVVLSSVAALRPRRAILTYAAAKAGLDAYARGLQEVVCDTGASIMVVRPGQVRTSMTSGRRDVPFTVNASDVARAIERGLRSGARVVYVPSVLRGVMAVLRAMPAPVFRRVTAERGSDAPAGDEAREVT